MPMTGFGEKKELLISKKNLRKRNYLTIQITFYNNIFVILSA